MEGRVAKGKVSEFGRGNLTEDKQTENEEKLDIINQKKGRLQRGPKNVL